MSGSIKCPCCGVYKMVPGFVSTSNTPWTNKCSCSDRERCMYHKFNRKDAPKRPPEDVLRERAEIEHQKTLLELKEIEKRFEEIKLILMQHNLGVK